MVQVASVQTLHRRAIKAATMELPEAKLVIVDELDSSVFECGLNFDQS
jgi:superfamily II DNA or RNA helicase